MFPLFGPEDFGFYLGSPDHAGVPVSRANHDMEAEDSRLAFRTAARLKDLVRPGYSVVVEVQNRVVILEGVVSAASLRRRLSETVWQTAGVFDVSNRLVVRSE